MYGGGSGSRKVSFVLKCYCKASPGPHKYVIDKRRSELLGNRVILPGEILGQLQIRFRHSMPSPLLFRVVNTKYNKESHCGMVEFTAPRGCAILSNNLFSDMMLQTGDSMAFTLKELPKLNYVKFQPFKWKFGLIKDPKSVLTRELQNYVALTEGDVVTISDNKGDRFRLTCIDVKSNSSKGEVKAGCILNTDLTTEFDQPVKKPPESKPLALDRPYKSVLQPRRYQYYRVKVVDPYIPLKITATTADEKNGIQIFASKDTQFVTSSECQWAGSREDPIIINPEPKGDEKRHPTTWYYLSVYANSAAEVQYTLTAEEDLIEDDPDTPRSQKGIGSIAAWDKQDERGRRRNRDGSKSRRGSGSWGSRSPSPGRILGRKGSKREDRSAKTSPTNSMANSMEALSIESKSPVEEKLDAKAIREKRLAALSKYAQRSSTPPSAGRRKI